MTEYNFDTADLPEAIKAMQENIQKKQEACALAEAEYVKYCSQFDASLKALQEMKARRFTKEKVEYAIVVNQIKEELTPLEPSQKVFTLSFHDSIGTKTADNTKKVHLSIKEVQEILQIVSESTEDILNIVNNWVNNELRSSKFKVEECDKSSVEFYSKVTEAKEIVNDLKEKMSEENLALRENDKHFKEDIIAMAERLCSYRETYDRTVLSEELKELCKENQLIKQELEDVKHCLKDLKSQFPLLPDPTVECVSQSLSKIRPCLEREIEELKSQNQSLQQRAKLLEANKSILMM